MARRTQNPFEKAVAAHERVIAKRPVDRATLLSSLGTIMRIGTQELNNDLGKVNFANTAAPLYAGALVLNEQQLVQPPLTAEQQAELSGKFETLSIFTQGNGDPGQTGPTNPDDIPTRGRK